jgi:hypothetical protein
MLLLTIVSPNCRVASQIPTLCEVGRKEERETFDGKVGGEPLPYVVVSLSFHFSFWEGRFQVVVSLGFLFGQPFHTFSPLMSLLTSKGQRKLYIHVTTLVEKHIVSIRGILPSAISYCLASARDFIAQFP